MTEATHIPTVIETGIWRLNHINHDLTSLDVAVETRRMRYYVCETCKERHLYAIVPLTTVTGRLSSPAGKSNKPKAHKPTKKKRAKR